jgi:hypothetical protein
MKMKRNLSMSLFLALGAAVAGCAADAPGTDDDGNDVIPPDQQPVPLTPEGRFSVQSDFDVATNLPGTAGTVVNYFINATDDPDDPTKFIVEQVVAALPNGSIKNNLQGAIPFVAGYLNDRLLEVAPEFVTKIVNVGDAFGQVAHHFGTTEVLEITAAGAAKKTVQGLHFKVDNVDLDFAFADYQIAPVTVEGLQVQLDQTGKLSFSAHKVPLKYGAIMKLAMNQVIIPMIDPSVQDLEGLLKTMVNCQSVGQYINEAVDFGSPSTYESACNAGLKAASVTFYSQLDRIDTAALEFGLTGTARGIDKNRDGKMDDIQTGIWTGELKYAGSPAPLATARFFGTKM